MEDEDYKNKATEYEKGIAEKAKKIHDLCEENGWVPISMKNDWLTVFGDGVTKKG